MEGYERRDPSGGIRAEGSKWRDTSDGIRVEGSEWRDPRVWIQAEESKWKDPNGGPIAALLSCGISSCYVNFIITICYNIIFCQILEMGSGFESV